LFTAVSRWNACSSCHDNPAKSRRFLVLPSVLTSTFYFVDTSEGRTPKLHKVVDGKEITEKTGLVMFKYFDLELLSDRSDFVFPIFD